MKTLKEIKTYLDKLSNQNQKDIEEVEKTIAELDEIIATSNEELSKATKAADYDSYDKAKKELWTAQNKKELAQNLLGSLKDFPIVNREEYDDLLARALAAHKNKEQELIEQAWKIILQLKGIKEKAQDNQESLRAVLNTLETDIGRQSEDYKRNSSGAILSDRYFSLEYGHLKPSAVVSLYDDITCLHVFSTIKK